MNLPTLPLARFDVSVIIPVEFHRDQAVACVRGWAQSQDCRAEQYQLIICAPDTLDPETEMEIRAVLRSWDRLEKRATRHDMALVAESAKSAESDLLLFTESHCLPHADAVTSLLRGAAENPEWAGFSCPTTPLTHNLLSEIEAEIYDTHIREQLHSIGWRHIIDQCFVVRRVAYFEAGGFRESFGHFAEWLLAAEMHRLGKTIGYFPHDLLGHYYSGVLRYLEEFTLDFARGQIKYLAECAHEPAARYFQNLPELQEFCRRSQADYRSLAMVKTATLPAALIHSFRRWKTGESRVSVSALTADWLACAFKGVSMHSTKAWASWSAHRAKGRLEQSLHRMDRATGRTDFLDWLAKLTHLGRLQYLADKPSLQGSFVRAGECPASSEMDWRGASGGAALPEWMGLLDEEETSSGDTLRWSNTTACVWLPLHAGRYQVILEWDKARPLSFNELLRVGFDGGRILPSAIELSPTKLVINLPVTNKAWHRLDWTVTAFPALNDRRLLGLPITAIRWSLCQQSADPRDDDALPEKIPCGRLL